MRQEQHWEMPPVGTWNALAKPHADSSWKFLAWTTAQRVLLILASVVCLDVCVFVFGRHRQPGSIENLKLATYTMISLGVAALVAHLWRESLRTQNARRQDLSFLEDPDDPNVCLVNIEVCEGNGCLGTDRGVCWFQDECLMFSGHNFSFCVGGQDLVPQEELAEILESRKKSGVLSLYTEQAPKSVVLRHPDRFIFITLSQLARNSYVGSESGERFRHTLQNFKENPQVAIGMREYPPLTPLNIVREHERRQALVARKALRDASKGVLDEI